jgi:S-disulfanyl-L-cysteine oxidoreductase SoxD
MKKLLATVASLCLGMGASVLALKAQGASRNVWDGVYTADQAAQGKALYESKCALCHGAELTGAEMAPPLSGAVFMGNWAGLSVGDLFTRIHTTMPANDPGTLSNADAALAVAYILSFNQFPAGATPLPSEDAALGQIAITAEKPAGK